MRGLYFSNTIAPIFLQVILAIPVASEGRMANVNVRPSLLMNQNLIERLNANVDALMKFSEIVSRLKLADSDDPEQREKIITSAQNILRYLDFIRQELGSKKLILSDEVLSQLNANAETAISILSKLDQVNPRLDKKGQERIQAIERGLNLKMSRFNEIKGTPTKPPDTYPVVRVIVRTLKTDGNVEPNLQIYYLEESYYDGNAFYDADEARKSTKTFERVSSPSDRELPEANYWVWAGRGNNPTPISGIKRLEVRRPSTGKEIEVDLIVDK